MTGASGGFVLDRVSVVRSPVTILDEVSVSVPAGRCTTVVGPSGSGKSMLLRLLNRLIDPTAGRVLHDGARLSTVDVLGLCRRVGLVAQHPVLLTERVAEDLRVGRPGLDDDQVADLLARVGLPAGFGRHGTGGLSGGEAQRVCLARALAVEPEVLAAGRADVRVGRGERRGGRRPGPPARPRRGHGGAGQPRPVGGSGGRRPGAGPRPGRLVAASHPREVDYVEAR